MTTNTRPIVLAHRDYRVASPTPIETKILPAGKRDVAAVLLEQAARVDGANPVLLVDTPQVRTVVQLAAVLELDVAVLRDDGTELPSDFILATNQLPSVDVTQLTNGEAVGPAADSIDQRTPPQATDITELGVLVRDKPVFAGGNNDSETNTNTD